MEVVLVFSFGYLVNLGIIMVLVGKWDLILVDEYNYFSLKCGVQLSGVKVINYDYGCLEVLIDLLMKY